MPGREKPVSYLNRIAMRILCIIVIIAVTSGIMTFLQVNPASYLPYLYFCVAMLVLSSFLHNKGGEVILNA